MHTSNFLLPLFALILTFIPLEENKPTNFSLETGLIAHYSFNNCDARDDSGNGSDGQTFGDITCWCGVDDYGLLLDGKDDYIEFPGRVNQCFNTTDFTVSFYIKPNKLSVFRESLISKRAICDDNNMIDLQLNVPQDRIETLVHETPTKSYGDISPDFIGEGWIHYAIVRKGTRAYTYINGEAQKEGFRCSGIDITNDAVFSFSNSPCIAPDDVHRFRGLLDELRVYDRAFTDQEILSLYSIYPKENAEKDCLT